MSENRMRMKRDRRRGDFPAAANPRPRREDVPDPQDDEWDAFLKIVGDVETASEILIAEFAKKSSKQGECVSYLRKLINRTFKHHQMNPEDDEQCADTILRALFQLTLRSWSISENILADLLSLGMTEVRHFSSTALSSIISKYGLQYMLDNEESELPVGWIDMFGKVASALTTRGDISHEDDIVDGKEFRRYIVTDICRMDWSKKIVVSLVSILEEIPGIEMSEVDIILEALGRSLKTMSPSAIPLVLNRIVTLTGPFRPALLLKTCDDYFGPAQTLLKCANKKNQKEFSDVVAKRKALATVAFHFVDASRHCDQIVREVLKRVKASVYDHSLVMTPFILAVVLGMTSVNYLKLSIVEPLKIAIIKSFHDQNLSKASKFYQETRGEVPNEITDCFKAVLTTRSSALEYMSEGLKDLGVGLLGADTLQVKYPMTLKPCTDLGLFLITSIIQSNKAYLGTIMNELLKQRSTPHIECLAACFSICSRAVGHRDFHGRMHELMQHLPLMSVETVSILVKSLIPSLQMSPTLLDELMMVLRKTFSKSGESGRICVEAMCVILSKSVVVGDIPIEEIRGPARSDDLLFSQLTQGPSQAKAITAVDYAPLCFEILSMAKRFFLLDCKVREQLYLGLHRVSRSNPLLTEIICGQLFTHASQYMPSNPMGKVTQDSVTFKSLFEFSSENHRFVSVKDELGFLVQCIGFALLKAHPVAVDSESYRSCRLIMENWIIFSSEVDVDILELITSSILDLAGGSKPMELARYVKEVLMMQIMQVITALIEHIGLTSTYESGSSAIKPYRNSDARVLKLYNKYKELDTAMKDEALIKRIKIVGGKKNKKDNKKKEDTLNENDNDTASVASSLSSCNPSAKVRKIDLMPSTPVYYPIMNLDSVCIMLREIYGITTENKALKNVKELEGFEMMLLQTISEKVERLKTKWSIRERQRAPSDAHNALTLITNIIWKRLCAMVEIQKTKGTSVESTELVETRLEVISAILNFFSQQGLEDRVLNFNIISKYAEFQNSEDNREALTKLVAQLFKEWKRVLKLVTAVFDGIQGNSCPILFNILNLVCKVMPRIENLDVIRKWTWEYLKDSKDATEGPVELLENVLTVFLTSASKCITFPVNKEKSDILRLAKAVRVVIGDVDEEECNNRDKTSWLITEDSVPDLVCSIVAFVEMQLNMVSSILGRLKAHGHYLSIEKSSAMRENCYKMINSVRLILTELVCTAFKSSPCVTVLLKVIPQIYNVMSCFAEHLLDLCRKKEECRLTSYKALVGYFGKQFKISVERMIEHTECEQRKKLGDFFQLPMTKKGKKVSKVPASMRNQFSKDAKLIPNVVYQIEKFEKHIIALSNKIKVDLLSDMKLSTARDFRIEAVKFNQAVAEIENAEKSRVHTAQPIASDEDETMEDSSPQQVEVVKPKAGRKRKVPDIIRNNFV